MIALGDKILRTFVARPEPFASPNFDFKLEDLKGTEGLATLDVLPAGLVAFVPGILEVELFLGGWVEFSLSLSVAAVLVEAEPRDVPRAEGGSWSSAIIESR